MAKATNKTPDLTKLILNGKASRAEWKKFHKIGEDEELPFKDPKFEADVLPSRASMLTTLFKWSLACIHNFRKNVPTSLKIAVVCGKGQGATYMAERLYVLIRDYLNDDRSIAESAAVYMFTRQGTIVMAAGKAPVVAPGQQAKWIFVTDGVYPRNEYSDRGDALTKGVAITFVNDATELHKTFTEDPIIIKLPDLTEEEIFRIATQTNILPDNHKEETCEIIRRLLSRDVSPKAALDYLAVSSGLSYDKVGVSQNQIVEPYMLLESIISNNTEINVFDELDPQVLRTKLKSEVIDQDGITRLPFIGGADGLQDKPAGADRILLGQVPRLCLRASFPRLFGREEIVRIDMGEYIQSAP
jgi:hypothetical protein